MRRLTGQESGPVVPYIDAPMNYRLGLTFPRVPR